MKKSCILLILCCLLLTLFVSCDDHYVPEPRVKPEFVCFDYEDILERLGKNFEITISFSASVCSEEDEEDVIKNFELNTKKVDGTIISEGKVDEEDYGKRYFDGTYVLDWYDRPSDEFDHIEKIYDERGLEFFLANSAIYKMADNYWDCCSGEDIEVELIGHRILLDRWMDVYEYIDTNVILGSFRCLFYVDRITKVIFKMEVFDIDNNLIEDVGYEITKLVQGGVTIPEQTISEWPDKSRFDALSCPFIEGFEGDFQCINYYREDYEQLDGMITDFEVCKYANEETLENLCQTAFEAGYCYDASGNLASDYSELFDVNHIYYGYTKDTVSHTDLRLYEQYSETGPVLLLIAHFYLDDLPQILPEDEVVTPVEEE